MKGSSKHEKRRHANNFFISFEQNIRSSFNDSSSSKRLMWFLHVRSLNEIGR